MTVRGEIRKNTNMPGTQARRRIVEQARRIVVKVGTNAICDETGRVNVKAVRDLGGQVAGVMKQGVSVVLITSGAIGAGISELNLPSRPKTMPNLQAAAAVGQGQLMRIFHDTFARRGVKVAQVLLTRDGFSDRTRYLNVRNTLRALEEMNVLPIINENDAVSVDEIRFGDNDLLAALVTNLVGADLLVLLTVVDGVIRDGAVLDVIERVDDETMALVGEDRSSFGVGGMGTKLMAADMVTRAGEVAVIANARTPDVLKRLMQGEPIGTVFVPARRRMSSRRRWIGQASRPAGCLVIDAGAVSALVKRGKSLLPSGVTAVDGKFSKGAVVTVMDPRGKEIARGLTNYSSEQLQAIKGLKTNRIAAVLGDKPYDEVVHRNNMTLS